MKKIVYLFALLIICVACAQETTPEPQPTESVDSSSATWRESFNFCRPDPDDPTGPSNCWTFKTAEEWLEFGPQLGDEIWIWPEGMPLPPLPSGLVWSRQRDDSIGESYWIVVEK